MLLSVSAKAVKLLQALADLIGRRANADGIEKAEQAEQAFRLIGIGEFLAAFRTVFAKYAIPVGIQKTAGPVNFLPFPIHLFQMRGNEFLFRHAETDSIPFNVLLRDFRMH